MIGDLSLEDAAAFIANRKAAGFNAFWVNLLCALHGHGRQAEFVKPS
jgi:hypothetical protein